MNNKKQTTLKSLNDIFKEIYTPELVKLILDGAPFREPSKEDKIQQQFDKDLKNILDE